MMMVVVVEEEKMVLGMGRKSRETLWEIFLKMTSNNSRRNLKDMASASTALKENWHT